MPPDFLQPLLHVEQAVAGRGPQTVHGHSGQVPHPLGVESTAVVGQTQFEAGRHQFQDHLNFGGLGVFDDVVLPKLELPEGGTIVLTLARNGRTLNV